MTRRPSTTRIVLSLVAALGGLAARPGPASGSTLVNFRLTNESTRPVSGVEFRVLPPGAVVPPVVGTDPDTGRPITGAPVTLLPSSTGFDATKFSVALGRGDGEQRLRLLFGQRQTVGEDGETTLEPILDAEGQPIGLFMPGAVLNFALSVDAASRDMLQLLLPEGVTGLSLKSFAPPDPTTDPTPPGPDTNGTPANQIPEPTTLLLWSALAALGLARAQTYRRSHRPA